MRPPVPRGAADVCRRALLPLPLLALMPLRTPAGQDGLGVADGAIGDKFSVTTGGVTKQLTEIEARGELSKKLDAATAAGKGIDIERRGVVNEKALFSEDFYFKYGLRPGPDEALRSPYVPPQAEELPFSPIKRRYGGYSKYAERIQGGIAIYTGSLRDAVDSGSPQEISALLEKGKKGSGSNSKGEGTGIPASDMRSACRAFGLFANTVLQSENDSGTTPVNLLVRHLINELYFAMDDIETAAQAGNRAGAVTAWKTGREYLNAYVTIVNFPLNERVGDKFPTVPLVKPPPPPPPTPPPAEGEGEAAAAAAPAA